MLNYNENFYFFLKLIILEPFSQSEFPVHKHEINRIHEVLAPEIDDLHLWAKVPK